MLQRIDTSFVSPPPTYPAVTQLWRLARRRISRSAFPYFLTGSVLLPIGFLTFAVQDERMRSAVLLFTPAVIALVILAAYAWRRHGDLELTVDLRTRALTNALGEKEQLLKEVHHRVKNNMQIISSLIRMQDRGKTSPDETIRRIQAMALVHDLIYTQGQFASVDLAAYTRRLCEALHANEGGRTTFELQLEPVAIALDRAMPFALILNEVVTNAIRHALKESAGTIMIGLTVRTGVAKLTVSDNGTALSLEVDGRGFGLRLVDGLSAQLGAVTTFEREDGTTFRMTFPTG